VTVEDLLALYVLHFLDFLFTEKCRPLTKLPNRKVEVKVVRKPFVLSREISFASLLE
jgi:hypothetical protein